MSTATQEYSVIPHTVPVWRSLRGLAKPGDRLVTSLMPIWDADQGRALTHAEWLAELIAALDEGIEVHCEECGNLRHGSAVFRALQRTMAEHEAAVAKRVSEAQEQVADAQAALKHEFLQGFDRGMVAAKASEKAWHEREKARERQQRKRERDAAADDEAQAEADAAERTDPASPHYTTSAA